MYADDKGTVAIGMPNHTCWANSELSPPPRPGYYRTTTHPNALEFFGRWDGKRWVHVSTKAAPMDALPLNVNFSTDKTTWWRDLEESERSKFPWEEEKTEEAPASSTPRFQFDLPRSVRRVFRVTCMRV